MSNEEQRLQALRDKVKRLQGEGYNIHLPEEALLDLSFAVEDPIAEMESMIDNEARQQDEMKQGS